jgi:hypothetical protein
MDVQQVPWTRFGCTKQAYFLPSFLKMGPIHAQNPEKTEIPSRKNVAIIRFPATYRFSDRL